MELGGTGTNPCLVLVKSFRLSASVELISVRSELIAAARAFASSFTLPVNSFFKAISALLRAVASLLTAVNTCASSLARVAASSLTAFNTRVSSFARSVASSLTAFVSSAFNALSAFARAVVSLLTAVNTCASSLARVAASFEMDACKSFSAAFLIAVSLAICSRKRSSVIACALSLSPIVANSPALKFSSACIRAAFSASIAPLYSLRIRSSLASRSAASLDNAFNICVSDSLKLAAVSSINVLSAVSCVFNNATCES